MKALPELKRNINSTKRALKKLFLKEVEPLLYDSGYTTAVVESEGIFGEKGSRPYRMYCDDDNFPIKIKGFRFEEIVAFTEKGVMTDAYGGGCGTLPFKDMPIEDLILITKALQKVKKKLS